MKTITELTIDRKEWLTPDRIEIGNTKTYSHLLNENGLKCCLGFLCLAMGKTKEQILGKTMPYLVFAKDEKTILTDFFSNEGLVINSDFSTAAADTNDNRCISNKIREEQLTTLFAENGIKLTFIN